MGKDLNEAVNCIFITKQSSHFVEINKLTIDTKDVILHLRQTQRLTH